MSAPSFFGPIPGGKEREKKAISELKTMLDRDPGNEKLALLRAQSLEAPGFIKEAEAAFESLRGGNDILSARADFWMRRKDMAKAGSLLEKISAGDPKNVDAATKLARIYDDRREFTEALHILGRTLKNFWTLRPGLPIEKRDFENARVYAQDAMAGSPKAVYRLHAAMILKALGKKKQALKHLEEAIENKSEGLDEKTLKSANRLKKEWSGS